MFKNLHSLKTTMRSILINLKKNNDLPDIEHDKDMAYALFCCCEHGYVLNLPCCQTVNGNYHFQKTGNIIVSEAGLAFIKQTSYFSFFIKKLFSLLHGMLGFLLGILSALIISYLRQYLGL